jgi:hypothetical protein
MSGYARGVVDEAPRHVETSKAPDRTTQRRSALSHTPVQVAPGTNIEASSAAGLSFASPPLRPLPLDSPMFFRAQNLGPLLDAEIDLSKNLIVLAGSNSSVVSIAPDRPRA